MGHQLGYGAAAPSDLYTLVMTVKELHHSMVNYVTHCLSAQVGEQTQQAALPGGPIEFQRMGEPFCRLVDPLTEGSGALRASGG